nr:putative movment protein [Solemoviridae sp.]QXV86656.1 putative movment protein [Solemoviridae sp.]
MPSVIVSCLNTRKVEFFQTKCWFDKTLELENDYVFVQDCVRDYTEISTIFVVLRCYTCADAKGFGRFVELREVTLKNIRTPEDHKHYTVRTSSCDNCEPCCRSDSESDSE